MSAKAAISLEQQLGQQNPWVADLWQPLSLGADNHYLFLNLSARHAPSQQNFFGEMGLVSRSTEVLNWGKYVYVNYNLTPQGQYFFGVNPGLELLTPGGLLGINAYLPIGASAKNVGGIQFANELGIDNYVYFKDHSMWDKLVQQSNISSFGFDANWLLQFPKVPLQFGVSPYYYQFSKEPSQVSQSVTGVHAQLKLQFERFKHIEGGLHYSYDNYLHHRFTFSLRFYPFAPEGKAKWYEAKPLHNVYAYGLGNSQPIAFNYRVVSPQLLYSDNVWFFKPASGSGSFHHESLTIENCTFEHPCETLSSDVTQQLSLLNSGAKYQQSIFLAPGTYTEPDTLVLYKNQSLIGRNDGYKLPASSDNLPILKTEQLYIDGVNQNTNNQLQNFRIENTGKDYAAIFINNAGDVAIENVQVLASVNNHLSTDFHGGIYVINSNSLSIKNSRIEIDNSFDTDLPTILLYMYDTKTVTIENSVLKETVTGSLAGDAVGISIGGSYGTLNFINSELSVWKQENNNSRLDTSLAMGIASALGISGELNIINSTFGVTSLGAQGRAYGMEINGEQIGNVQNSIFSAVTSSDLTNQGAWNFIVSQNAKLTVASSRISASGTSENGSAAATNFNVFGNAIVNINDSVINAVGQSHDVTGSTNVTSSDNGIVNINHSYLKTAMAGGLAGVGHEPSGAVSLWALNASKINVSNSEVIAQASNASTIATVAQSQDTSKIFLDGSVLKSFQQYGNANSGTPVEVLVAAGDSLLTISNSSLQAIISGTLVNPYVSLVNAYDRSNIQITNSLLISSLNSASSNYWNYGVVAYSNARIHVSNSKIILNGGKVQTTDEIDGGEVVID